MDVSHASKDGRFVLRWDFHPKIHPDIPSQTIHKHKRRSNRIIRARFKPMNSRNRDTAFLLHQFNCIIFTLHSSMAFFSSGIISSCHGRRGIVSLATHLTPSSNSIIRTMWLYPEPMSDRSLHCVPLRLSEAYSTRAFQSVESRNPCPRRRTGFVSSREER